MTGIKFLELYFFIKKSLVRLRFRSLGYGIFIYAPCDSDFSIK